MKTVAGQAHRWLSALVIVSALSGCDNVEWGGAEWRLEEPPPRVQPDAGADAAAGPEEEPIELPEGPVLYAGARDGDAVRVVPVAEISGDSLLPFPGDVDQARWRAAFARSRMAPGTRFVLFAGGTRVGTLIADGIVRDTTWCQERPAALGPVELVPAAQDVSRFVALPEEQVSGLPHGDFRDLPEGTGERAASVSLLAGLIPRLRARWPGDLTAARADLEAFSMGPGDEAFAATFLMGDELGTEAAPGWAWSIFMIASPEEGAYQPDYVWYRLVSEGGKTAPRFLQAFDWDRDGQDEYLVELFGEEARWLGAIGRRGGELRPIYQDPCAPDPGFSTPGSGPS